MLANNVPKATGVQVTNQCQLAIPDGRVHACCAEYTVTQNHVRMFSPSNVRMMIVTKGNTWQYFVAPTTPTFYIVTSTTRRPVQKDANLSHLPGFIYRRIRTTGRPGVHI